MKIKIEFLVQDYEWYGDDEMVQGRWKPKGGSCYIISILESFWYHNESKVVEWFKTTLPGANGGGMWKQEYINHGITEESEDITEKFENEFLTKE